jgi:hypothetical protein
MRDEIPAILVALLLLTAGFGGAGIGSIPLTKDCKIIEGEIVGKSHDTGFFILYVILRDDGKNEDYMVYVGPETYENYEIGEIWGEEMCSISEYEELMEIIQQLLDAGLVESLNS